MKYIIYWVRDDDSLVSDTTKYSIFVRLAPPVLWGDNTTKDTIWTVINNGAGFYKIHVNAFDTNGTIQKYFWDDKQGWKDSTLIDSIAYQFRQGDINHGTSFAISARDDDGIVTSKNLFIYADSVPPPPLFTYDKPTGQVRIGWIGKDGKDGNGTMFEILLKKGSAPASTDTLLPFTPGTSLNPGLYTYDFSYTFIPSGGNGTYYYQVIAKDARGSTSSNSASFFNFP